MELTNLFSLEDIEFKSLYLSKRIKQDFSNDNPIFLVVLGGAMIFASVVIPDNLICEIDYIKVASYEGTERKELKLIYEPVLDIQDRIIIIIEDIVDSGTTIEYLHNYLKSKNVKDVKVVSLLYKKQTEHLVDYGGFPIQKDDFVVGYGLDYKGHYRNYRGIYTIH